MPKSPKRSLASRPIAAQSETIPVWPVDLGLEQGSDAESVELKPDLVRRVQAGEAGAIEELYRMFSRGIRYYLSRHLGPQGLEERVQDTFLIVVQAIQMGGLEEPEKLMGFVSTVMRRQVAAFLGTEAYSHRDFVDMGLGGAIPDGGANPELKLMRGERADLLLQALRGISPRDREILTRCYLDGQPQAQICEEMALTETQFRLLKSRAKARVVELGRRRLRQDAPPGPAPLTKKGTAPGQGPVAVAGLVPVVAHAVAVFGDERKATHWLSTPLRLLDDHSPSETLATPGGLEKVERILTRIEHNIPS